MEDLSKALESPNENDRLFAVQDIQELNRKDLSIQVLERFKVETSQIVREAIVEAFKEMDISAIFESLFELFLSPDAYLRNATISIFSSHGELALAFLTSKMDHSNKEVRKLILDTIVQIQGENSILAIRASVYDPDPNVKTTAIEYLCQLKDKDCIPEILILLKDQAEPMLIITILDTVLKIGSDSDIEQALEMMLSEKNIDEVDPIYLPNLFEMTGKVGDPGKIVEIINNLSSIDVYADNIVKLIGEAQRRFGIDFPISRVFLRINSILQNTDVKEEVRLAGVDYLTNYQFEQEEKEKIFELGKKLALESESMVLPAIKLLIASEKKESREIITQIIEETENEEILELSKDLIEGLKIDL